MSKQKQQFDSIKKAITNQDLVNFSEKIVDSSLDKLNKVSLYERLIQIIESFSLSFELITQIFSDVDKSVADKLHGFKDSEADPNFYKQN